MNWGIPITNSSLADCIYLNQSLPISTHQSTVMLRLYLHSSSVTSGLAAPSVSKAKMDARGKQPECSLAALLSSMVLLLYCLFSTQLHDLSSLTLLQRLASHPRVGISSSPNAWHTSHHNGASSPNLRSCLRTKGLQDRQCWYSSRHRRHQSLVP